MDVARVIQLTDCHLGPGPDFSLAGMRTSRTLADVVMRIRDEEVVPDMVMATGDIAAQGNRRAYDHFVQVMEGLGLPYAWLPGNHDDFKLMQEGIKSAPYWSMLDLGEWRLISLNTAIPGRVEGRLTTEELEFLAHALDREQRYPVAIFMHHPPVDIGCAWLDAQQVVNSAELAGLVRAAGNVKAIFTGHVHQAKVTEFAGVPLITTPSTCFQFAPDSDEFALAEDLPAYRRIDLYANGLFETDIVRVSTEERVDTANTGY